MALNSLWKRSLFWKDSCSVAIVVVIYVVIGGFNWKYLKWLAQEIFRLQPTVQLHCPIMILQIN